MNKWILIFSFAATTIGCSTVQPVQQAGGTGLSLTQQGKNRTITHYTLNAEDPSLQEKKLLEIPDNEKIVRVSLSEDANAVMHAQLTALGQQIAVKLAKLNVRLTAMGVEIKGMGDDVIERTIDQLCALAANSSRRIQECEQEGEEETDETGVKRRNPEVRLTAIVARMFSAKEFRIRSYTDQKPENFDWTLIDLPGVESRPPLLVETRPKFFSPEIGKAIKGWFRPDAVRKMYACNLDKLGIAYQCKSLAGPKPAAPKAVVTPVVASATPKAAQPAVVQGGAPVAPAPQPAAAGPAPKFVPAYVAPVK